MKLKVLYLTAAATLALPSAALASNRVVINKSIDGIKLGATEKQVEAAAGKPAQILDANKSYTSFNYGDADQLEVNFDKVRGKKLVTEVISEPGYRDPKTSKGIGFNSTKKAVMHAYPTAKYVKSWGQIWIDENGTDSTGFLLDRSNRVMQISVQWNYG